MLYKQRVEAKVYCKICNFWYQNNAACKRQHMESPQHKKNVELSLAEMKAKGSQIKTSEPFKE
ncbi:MAG: hypothetical protein MHPSP_000747, partial [Paramarteilia canceri]